jgi:hypothetical protein
MSNGKRGGTTIQWNLSIVPSLKARLERLSKATGRSMSWYVIRGLTQHVFPTYDPDGTLSRVPEDEDA